MKAIILKNQIKHEKESEENKNLLTGHAYNLRRHWSVAHTKENCQGFVG
jgi:hypothetical protein